MRQLRLRQNQNRFRRLHRHHHRPQPLPLSLQPSFFSFVLEIPTAIYRGLDGAIHSHLCFKWAHPSRQLNPPPFPTMFATREGALYNVRELCIA